MTRAPLDTYRGSQLLDLIGSFALSSQPKLSRPKKRRAPSIRAPETRSDERTDPKVRSPRVGVATLVQRRADAAAEEKHGWSGPGDREAPTGRDEGEGDLRGKASGAREGLEGGEDPAVAGGGETRAAGNPQPAVRRVLAVRAERQRERTEKDRSQATVVSNTFTGSLLYPASKVTVRPYLGC